MRYRLRTLLIVLAVLPPLLAVIGIAVFDLKREPLSVSGVVTYRGRPLQAGGVYFVPIAPGDGPVLQAVTDLDGRYRLDSKKQGLEIAPGDYHVIFYASAVKRGLIGYHPTTLPAQYGDAATSEITVRLSEPNSQFDFDLK